MALDPVPWAVGNGAEHSPEIARLLGYAASGGLQGVIGSDAFKVSQLPSPGAAVRVSPGAATILNAYGGGAHQSYLVRGATNSDVSISPTGSASGRSDLVVIRVTDPQYGGAAPPDPANGPYVSFHVIQGVAAGTAVVPSGTGYPAVPLARIDIPANTSAITGAMIKDVRELPLPMTKRDVFARPSSGPASANPVDPTTMVYARWPDAAFATVTVPSWATRAIIRADVNNYIVKTGWVHGRVNIRLGSQPLSTEIGSFDEQWNNDSYRSSVAVVTDMAIPPAIRGTQQVLEIRAVKTSGTGIADADEFTTTWFDVQWIQGVE